MTDIAHLTSGDRCIISCGMLHPEIAHLREIGFLNARRILFTPPGLHAPPDKLEEHLLCPDCELEHREALRRLMANQSERGALPLTG